MQHVADMNLPPFYSDHEQDPVCIYEHELPLDALPPVQPILVHAASEVQIIIPPEDDPLVASPTAIQRSYSGLRIPVESIAEDEPTVTEMEVFSGMETTTTAMETELNQVLDNPASPSSLAGTATPSPRMRPSLALRLTGLSGRSTPTITSSSTSPLGPPVALAGSTSPAIQSPSPAALSSPRIIDRDMLNRARLQLPPSYDVPNRVIGRSPLMVQHLHPTQPDDDDFSLPTACIRDDYFSRVRVRSYTVSNPPQHHPSQFQQHFNQGTGLSTATMAGGHSGSLPETPRYSLEFPSHVPHHQHLEHYQRARALAATVADQSSGCGQEPRLSESRPRS
ncbi:hypothetical protein BGZ83_005670 [Gryganskiella cystojenkinii]|nr:hypothetical protein BGZ83_005670 [Gryganskiella cystojenkinii]